jgi:hypothetical protein
MKSAAIVLAAWTALLVGHVVLLWIWWQDPVSLEVSWISTAIVAAATVAVLLGARRHPEAAESEPPGAVRAVPDASVGAALTAIGVAVAAYGLVFGTGVLLMGAGLAALGLVRLVAERRDERRATARALERSSRP